MENEPTPQSGWTTHLSGMSVSFNTHALRSCWLLRLNGRVVTAVFVEGSGAHLLCSAQIKTEMKGMRSEWSAQRALRVRVYAVLAMHVPNSGIHTLCRFPCAPIHPCPLFTGKKRKCLLVFVLLQRSNRVA